MRLWLVACLLVAGCAAGAPAGVAGMTPQAGGGYAVVAIGASNTEGRGQGRTADGVPPELAYPAQLERLLASQGCPVRVRNAGIAGDTTEGMLARLPGVIDRTTKVVILQPGGNDARRGAGGETGANMEALRRVVADRGAKAVVLDGLGRIAGPQRLPDGQHFSAEGHARFAAALAPRVREAGACGP